MEAPAPNEPRTAVVLSGALARGAFQVGALAEVLTELESTGTSPSIVLGTSAGAINAALYGSFVHLGPGSAGKEMAGLWRRMSHADVFRPLMAGTLVSAGVEFSAGALLARGGGLTSLLDTEPLAETARTELDTRQLADNVRAGLLGTVGVVATRVPPASGAEEGTSSGRSVLFLHERSPSDYAGDPARALDVVRGPIRAEHVLASAAVPVAFPPQRVAQPACAAGWYVDGGLRLNAPLRPAIMLGATRIIVISATSTEYNAPLPPDPDGAAPDVADTGAQVMHAVLADRLAEDLLAIQRKNSMLEQMASSAREPGAVLRGRDGNAYRPIEVLTVSPPPAAMGHLATDVLAAKTKRLGRLRDFDNWVLGKFLRGAGDATGNRELLSYLFFDEDYFDRSVELGRDAASRSLAAGWMT